ncbi:hypothetical protein [Amycolatopsis ruanii]|uniref:hypothetical protein n=1 Tax=Amycolatopsis ruanii TaxID=944491 RepID=UPI0013BE9DB9|nr:hypothetical protein [Amycolatopsis ruanii]
MPEPILVSIATAAATKAVQGLYELIKRRFADDPEATAVLETATPEAPETVEVLAERLDRAGREDPRFAEALREAWSQHGDGANNQISGTVHGNVVQARDINGNISF